MAGASSSDQAGARSAAPPASGSTAPAGEGHRTYTVLARRYRSREFDELIGQEPIARTLSNAVATGRTAHAYLFCGTRGVGKTSMARIFAKALNVTSELTEADAIAEAILRGEDLDVIEIDGASNRGVQEARDLIASAGLLPARCRCKIYIIDEVHMLTREAFNALLKTMEEPPSHVKFILCTTEPHKVPATIQSRCQRFDFRNIPSARIAAHLGEILTREGIDADEEVVAQVARLGNGSMRDALSLLDRLLAAGAPRLTTEVLEDMLGVPDQHLVLDIADAIVAQDAGAALRGGGALLDHGASIEQALEMIAEHLRLLLVARTCGGESELLDVSTETRQKAVDQAASFDAPGLVYMIAVCDAAARGARSSAAARALYDAALVRLSLGEHLADIAGLLREGAVPASPSKKKGLTSASSPARDPSPTRPPARPAAAAAVTEVKPPAPAGAAGDDGRALWARVLEVAAASGGDRARTEPLRYDSFDGTTLRLGIDESGADVARYLSTQVDRLIELVRRATGRTVRIELVATPASRAVAPTPAADLQAARQVPVVREAMELFDADVVEVRRRATGGSGAPGAGTTEEKGAENA